MADMAYRKLLYGDNVMGYLPGGNAETVGSIKLDDVKNYYNTLNAGMASIAVSGDIGQADVLKGLKFMERFRKGDAPANVQVETSKIDKTRIYFVDKKNAAQSEIRIGYIALPYDALGDYYKSTIMNFSFAGAFNSRVNYLLREIKGWTYGTRGGFSGSRYAGPYTINGGFKANTTDSTLVEMFSEMKKFVGSGISEDELNFTKNAMLQSDALKYESPMQKLGFIKRVLEFNLDRNYVAQQSQLLAGISKKEIDELAKKYLPYDNMIVVVVGDKASNLDKVKKLGYEVVEIDANGKTIGQ
jgi:zinc protease